MQEALCQPLVLGAPQILLQVLSTVSVLGPQVECHVSDLRVSNCYVVKCH